MISWIQEISGLEASRNPHPQHYGWTRCSWRSFPAQMILWFHWLPTKHRWDLSTAIFGVWQGGVTGPWVRGMGGTGECGEQVTSSPALPLLLLEKPLKHNPNLQDNTRTRMGSSLSLWIQDFCHYSSFRAINLQEKYKDLQVFFSFMYKKVQNNFRLRAASSKSSKTLQRFHTMKDPHNSQPLNTTSENTNKRSIANSVGGSSHLLLVFKRDQNYFCLLFIF